jgi:hypothetical protein
VSIFVHPFQKGVGKKHSQRAMDSSKNYAQRIHVPSKTPLAHLLPSHEQKVGFALTEYKGAQTYSGDVLEIVRDAQAKNTVYHIGIQKLKN